MGLLPASTPLRSASLDQESYTSTTRKLRVHLPAFKDYNNTSSPMDTESQTDLASWAWLVVPKNGTLAIETTPNDDNPLDTGIGYPGNIPILGIDVWEHAYYLKHQYRRPDYIADWFNVVNWPQVNINYLAALKNDLTPLSSYP
ncbi:hypothetical protein CVIRNUC_008660 [Coccomyxa viridis]|uniref:Manganese/iron superoxide dismutase C-terminal domain-containing protein n=1 Tax=Coccomyxa viridis TaxID=1274662 RepID=A0AAV1IFG5_9CHLO|nr:hypothetical protein CVIRNUC_008660 [Coccomyxa viridis]